MKERIQHIINAESLTNLQFAQLLDISPAAVTHLLAGRNNPSLDIVVKIARKLPHYNLRWLLLGEGATYDHTTNGTLNGDRQRDLFAATPESVIRNQSPVPAEALPYAPHSQSEHTEHTDANTNTTAAPAVSPEPQKLIVCLPDGTYREYTKQH